MKGKERQRETKDRQREITGKEAQKTKRQKTETKHKTDKTYIHILIERDRQNESQKKRDKARDRQ